MNKDISSITGLAFVDGVKPFDTRDAELILSGCRSGLSDMRLNVAKSMIATPISGKSCR